MILALPDYRTNLICELLFGNEPNSFADSTPIIGHNPALLNGDFETAGAGGADVFANWLETVISTSTISQEAVIFHSGAKSCKFGVNAAQSDCYVRQVNAVPGKRYRIKFWARNGNGLVGGISFSHAGSALYSTGLLTAVFQQFSYEFTASSNDFKFGRQATISASASIYLDDVEICEIVPMEDTSENSFGAYVGSGAVRELDGILAKYIYNTAAADSILTVAPSATLQIATGVKSYVIWANLIALSNATGNLFSHGSKISGSFSNNGNRLYAYIFDGDELEEIEMFGGTIAAGEWAMYTLTIDVPNLTANLYKNNALVATHALPAGAYYTQSGNQIQFGQDLSDDPVNAHYRMFRLYNEALDLEKISKIYFNTRRSVLGLPPKP